MPNSMPKNILSEEKYISQKKKIKTAAICVLALAALSLIGAIALAVITNQNTKNDYQDKKTAYEQLLAEEEATFASSNSAALTDARALISQINAAKLAINPAYQESSGILNMTTEQKAALAQVDQEYSSQVDDINGKLPFGCRINGSQYNAYELFGNCTASGIAGEFNVLANGSNELKELEREYAMADDGSMFITPFTLLPFAAPLFLGMIGIIMLVFAHKREIAAHTVQAGLPIATEAIGKGVKALDDNGSLDTIAKTGAKILGKHPLDKK